MSVPGGRWFEVVPLFRAPCSTHKGNPWTAVRVFRDVQKSKMLLALCSCTLACDALMEASKKPPGISTETNRDLANLWHCWAPPALGKGERCGKVGKLPEGYTASRWQSQSKNPEFTLSLVPASLGWPLFQGAIAQMGNERHCKGIRQLNRL